MCRERKEIVSKIRVILDAKNGKATFYLYNPGVRMFEPTLKERMMKLVPILIVFYVVEK